MSLIQTLTPGLVPRAVPRLTPSASGGGFPAALKTGLVEWWQLDQASGNETGAVAGTVLTDTNTVGSRTGLGGQSTARSFVAGNSEYFVNTGDNSALDPNGGGFTVAMRVTLDQASATDQYLFSLYTNSINRLDVRYNIAERIECNYYVGATFRARMVSDTVLAGAWPYTTSIVCVSVNGSSNAIYIDGVSDALSSEITTGGGVAMTSPNVYIGSQNGSGGFFDGAVQEVMIAHRAWTQSDVDLYHNNGEALIYA